MDEANDLAEFTVDADSRAHTILIVSFLEDVLKQCFAEYWSITGSQNVDQYFGSNGPLSTFSQRTVVAKGISWLPEKFVSEINVLRKVRNAFAHDHRFHRISDSRLADTVQSITKFEQIWCDNDGYNKAYEAADEETKLRLRLFCAGIFILISVLTNAKLANAQVPPSFRPEGGWDQMLEVAQGLTDAAIRHCWRSLGLGYTGVVYEYRKDRAQT